MSLSVDHCLSSQTGSVLMEMPAGVLSQQSDRWFVDGDACRRAVSAVRQVVCWWRCRPACCVVAVNTSYDWQEDRWRVRNVQWRAERHQEGTDTEVSGTARLAPQVRRPGALGSHAPTRHWTIDAGLLFYFLLRSKPKHVGRSGFRHPGNTQRNPPDFFSKTHKKNRQKTAPNLIQFQFAMPVISKDFFMYTASNDQ